jgi:2-phosphoglycerate kinase
MNGVTPYEAWHERTPSVRHFKIFGYVAHVKLLGPGINKLADRSVQDVFVGYDRGGLEGLPGI